MLNKCIFCQPKEYPNKPIVMLEKMTIPLGDYSYCKSIELKIVEYLQSIQLEITLFLLEIEKKEKELYREPDEFAWTTSNNIILNQINNPIVLDGKDKDILLNSYDLFEPLYQRQLEDIYNFLKTNYSIDDYFRKKLEYERLNNKLKSKHKEDCKKI